MPVKSEPKERPLIKMLLSACDNGAWRGADLDWVEEKQDGAVEVVATAIVGRRLALEHTLIQPFVGEKFDSEAFVRTFGRIEKNSALVLPDRNLSVVIPVHAIPKGVNWDEAGQDVLTWLLAHHRDLQQEGESTQIVSVAARGNNGPLRLNVTLRITCLPGMPGSCLIARHHMPGDLAAIVEKALRTKIPKLVRTPADKRILLLERDRIIFGEGQIYDELLKLASRYPELAQVEEVWFADTSILVSEG